MTEERAEEDEMEGIWRGEARRREEAKKRRGQVVRAGEEEQG